MNSALLFDFTFDKTTNTVFIKKEFAAKLSLVWDAFTVKEILDQWWAPKPYTSRTKVMDFKVGGRRFYAMVSPEGQEHWGRQDYISISPKTNFKQENFFTDENENDTPGMPSSKWNLNFSEHEGTTTVAIVINLKSLADLETYVKMGFQGGFTMTLTYLETLLEQLS